MHRLVFVVSLIFLGGCALAPLPTASDPADGDSCDPVVSQAPPAEFFALAGFDLADEFFVHDPAALSLTGPVDWVRLVDPEFLPIDFAETETARDNRLLFDLDLHPPDCEGQTVASEEVSFDFPVVENDKVRYFIDYYTGRGRKGFKRWLERSTRYLPMMQKIFAEEGLPKDLTYLAMVESGFNTRAYSWAHAVGPWQFIGSTGRLYGLKQGWWLDERRDFERSTRAAARFLKDLHRQFDGDWYLAVASYNAGPGKLRRAIRKYNTRDFWKISRGKYLQTETKNYLPKLMAVLLVAKQPEKYGFTELAFQEPLAYETVTVPTATDLEVIADICEVEYREIKALNPELKRWCTPPGVKDYAVRIPPDKKEQFAQKYASLPEDGRANYKHHRISKGDTLLGLANRYGIRVDDIMALNRIGNPRSLRIGTDLILPLKKGYSRLPVDELQDDYIRTRRQRYTVRKGDSLWSISRRFGVTQKQLRVWNRLGWSNVIRPGQILGVSAKARRPAKRVSKGVATKQIVYRVKRGDTLWGIGRRFAVETGEILAWNNLSLGDVLRPGQKLTLKVAGG